VNKFAVHVFNDKERMKKTERRRLRIGRDVSVVFNTPSVHIFHRIIYDERKKKKKQLCRYGRVTLHRNDGFRLTVPTRDATSVGDVLRSTISPGITFVGTHRAPKTSDDSDSFRLDARTRTRWPPFILYSRTTIAVVSIRRNRYWNSDVQNVCTRTSRGRLYAAITDWPPYGSLTAECCVRVGTPSVGSRGRKPERLRPGDIDFGRYSSGNLSSSLSYPGGLPSRPKRFSRFSTRRFSFFDSIGSTGRTGRTLCFASY